MNQKNSRRFACALAMASAIAATSIAAAGSPVVIDSEKKADAAVVAAFDVKGSLPNRHRGAADFARSRIEDTLSKLAAGTTLTAVRSARDGVTLPCAAGGNLNARISRATPRLLRLAWTNCKYADFDGYPRERSGAAEVLLLSDSFSPDKVGAIRLGSADADFIETRVVDDEGQIQRDKWSSNMRLLGIIPMKRAFPLFGYFIGDFAFEMTGFYKGDSEFEQPGTGLPNSFTTFTVAPEFLFASGSLTYNTAKTHYVDDIKLHYGKLTYSSGAPGNEYTGSYAVDGLRVRSENDFATTLLQQDTIDGRVDLVFPDIPPYSSLSCRSGTYAFKTRAPLARAIFGSYQIESGDLVVNGTARAQFYTAANVPPNLPTPVNGNLVHLQVANLGTFDYDSSGLSNLSANAQCGP